MANSDLERMLNVPNGRVYKQPLGLFINNEFVSSSHGKTISSIEPA
jgi:aldehyde dehydrogenase (NAD(P)+)